MFRSIILSALIVMGLCVQSQRAEAGERRDIVVAGGCFWCVEADFEKVRGVLGAVTGNTGSTTDNTTYKQATRGGTGQHEAANNN